MPTKASNYVDDIIDLRICGETLAVIGDKYNVSRQRIDQLLSKSDKYKQMSIRPDDFLDYVISSDFIILDRGFKDSYCHIWRWNPGKAPKLNNIDVRVLVYTAQTHLRLSEIISVKHRVKSLCGQIRCCTLGHFKVSY